MENLHQYICGKSGSGKSTFLKNEILDEIEERDHAVFFIDPHGHDALDLLDAIPSDLTEKTCYIDLSDYHYAVGFNPLIKPAHTLSGLKSIWIDSWGPRMEWLLLNGLLVLAENPQATLEDLTPLYFDPVHREKLIGSAEEPRIAKTATRRFWFKEFPLKYEKSKDNPDSPILNKIGQLLTSDISRNLCQKSPKFDFRASIGRTLRRDRQPQQANDRRRSCSDLRLPLYHYAYVRHSWSTPHPARCTPTSSRPTALPCLPRCCRRCASSD